MTRRAPHPSTPSTQERKTGRGCRRRVRLKTYPSRDAGGCVQRVGSHPSTPSTLPVVSFEVGDHSIFPMTRHAARDSLSLPMTSGSSERGIPLGKAKRGHRKRPAGIRTPCCSPSMSLTRFNSGRARQRGDSR